MDKLKANIFGIAVGGIGIVLLVLAFLLVVQPLQSLGGIQSQIEEQTKKLQTLRKKKTIAVKEYLDHLKAKEAADNAALSEGVRTYEEQSKAFLAFFDGTNAQPDLNDFVTQYSDGIKKLIDDYRVKFKIAVEAEQADQAPPKVAKIDPIDESRIPLAMKEFWITSEIFAALNSLGVGGLKEIMYPRLVEQKETVPYRAYQVVQVKVEMPFSKIENFITELYASKKVPFLLKDLSYQKTPESLGLFQALSRTEDYKDQGEAKRAGYDELVPEPGVLVSMTLLALEWQGIPAEAPAGETPEKTTK
jgi:Na+-transporting methylmalonyl-CoA/oxaloacetate decarboxylase gamma subunit